MVIAGGPSGAVALQVGNRTKIAAALPITPAERLARLRRVQEAMRRRGMSALLVEAGSTLNYFTGIQWYRSERLTGALIPAEGEVLIVTPGFEEPKMREMLVVPGEVRVWQEDESASKLLAGWLRERKLAEGAIGVDETVRFFIINGLQQALPSVRIVDGAPVVNELRMIKTPSELALMQRASDITIAAYRATAPKIQRGMSNADIFKIMQAELVTLGAETTSGGAQIGEGSAYPHGSKRPEVVRDGSLILMDCGCTVDGYHADISRTFVFGEPSRQQRKVWSEVHRGQEIAFAAARVGAPAGTVDDAVRAYYEKIGYGPRYRTPGLPHRTGHGIGLDVHEPVNLVHGEMTRLAPGMCFSNEPGIYIHGAFGVRLEDCFYMTASGPRYFSTPPPSIDQPFA
jgi:Xaa-Pro dipeptidase